MILDDDINLMFLKSQVSSISMAVKHWQLPVALIANKP